MTVGLLPEREVHNEPFGSPAEVPSLFLKGRGSKLKSAFTCNPVLIENKEIYRGNYKSKETRYSRKA